MAFIEAAAPLLEGGGEAGAAGGLGSGMDFNDLPFGKIAGSEGGKLVHAVTGAIGTGSNYPHVDIGSMGNV
jgi:hypothetical protein